MNANLVSVVMPAFNAAKYIEESIQSIQNQTYGNWEVIVVDDGSTDDTSSIVKRMQANDKRIIYHYQQNQRLGAARNAGFRLANGEYIAFLDSDDLWAPEKLEKQLLIFDRMNVDLVFTNGFILQDTTKSLSSYPTQSGFYDSVDMYKQLYERNIIPVLAVMMKVDWIRKVGFQEEQPYFFGCEDWDYWLRMAKAGASFYGMEEKLFYYRRHNDNMSSNSTAMDLAQASSFIKNFVENGNPDIRTNIQSFVGSLIIRLVRENKIEEAKYLLKQMSDVMKRNHWIFRMMLLIFKRFAYFPILAMNKVNRFLYNKNVIG